MLNKQALKIKKDSLGLKNKRSEKMLSKISHPYKIPQIKLKKI